MPIRSFIPLLKLRISMMIALTAALGYIAIAKHVDAAQLVALLVAMTLGSASASVFNHFYDRDIDRLMHRTAGRLLARDALGNPSHVLYLAGALLVCGISLALYFLNIVVAVHLFLGAFVYAIIYTVLLKRRTWLNIVIGGAAGSFAVLAGGAAVDPQQWLLPLLLAVTLFLWTPSHFWALAILFKEDYARANLPMLPVLVGEAATAKAILVNSVLMVAAAALPWMLGELGWIYAVISTVLAAVLLWANWQLVRTPDRLWARRNFLGSMQYLAGLFVAVLLDVNFA